MLKLWPTNSIDRALKTINLKWIVVPNSIPHLFLILYHIRNMGIRPIPIILRARDDTTIRNIKTNLTATLTLCKTPIVLFKTTIKLQAFLPSSPHPQIIQVPKMRSNWISRPNSSTIRHGTPRITLSPTKSEWNSPLLWKRNIQPWPHHRSKLYW